MSDSILDTIKEMIGIIPTDTHFDTALITNINSYINVLNQVGIGVDDFRIQDNSDTWSDYFDGKVNNMAITYIYLRSKLVFDPPSTSFLIESIKSEIQELTWRLNLES